MKVEGSNPSHPTIFYLRSSKSVGTCHLRRLERSISSKKTRPMKGAKQMKYATYRAYAWLRGLSGLLAS